MGRHNTVLAELECERCHSKYSTDVQFHTDDDVDWLSCTVGQVISELSPGSTYQGIADAFCAKCMNDWVGEEKRAHFDELARSIESGEIIARNATYQADPWRPELGRQLDVVRQDPLTPGEVRRLADSPEWLGWPTFGARLLEATVTLFHGEFPLQDSSDPWWSEHVARVRTRLSASGWRAPADSQFRDVTVRVDQDGTIGVSLP